MRHKINLVLDPDGDVVMIRIPHHSGSGGRDVMVPWDSKHITEGNLQVVRVSYDFPPRKRK